MLKGIDVSSHDGRNGNSFARYNTEVAYAESDFIIIKATQGTGYVNKYCDWAYQRAKADGKLRGFYHYASGGNPEAEAEYFYNNTKGYTKDGIPVLDWEAYQNASWGNTSWCKRFADKYHALTGVWPMIYIQASARAQAASCSATCALWLAGYPDLRNSWNVPHFIYKTAPWDTYTVWQYTSGGNTDRNVSVLDANGWTKIATGGSTPTAATPTPAPAPSPTPAPAPAPAAPSIPQIAVDGYWGTATTRRLQQVLGTVADGEVWGQWSGNRSRLAACTDGWKFVNSNPSGSAVIRAMQQRLGVSADGIIGAGTIRALQSRMGTPVDGVLSGGGQSTCVKELQRRLNRNTF